MTQIIAALTQDYVLVASDRQLTYVRGPKKGKVANDNTCKLVSLCGLWGIAYTGFSELQGKPTHEWIALKLAEKGCSNSRLAAQILREEAVIALKSAPFIIEQQFLISGWVVSKESKTLQPHFLLVSNIHNSDGSLKEKADIDFVSFERKLLAEEEYASRVIGQPLSPSQGKRLHRFFRKILKHKISPKPAMLEFVNEVKKSSRPGGTVGDKVLAFSISKLAAEHTCLTGESMILAAEPDLTNTAFCYFDSGYSQLRQFGPTHVCGKSAFTDIETENDPDDDYQSSSVKILHMP